MLLSYTSCFLEFFCFYMLCKSFTLQPLIPQKIDIFFCILFVSIIGHPAFSQPLLCFLIGFTFCTIYCIHICSRNVLNGILLLLLSWGCIALTQILLLFLLSILHLSPTLSYMKIIGNFCSILICFSFMQISKMKRSYYHIIYAKLLYQLIFFNTIFVILGIILFWKFFPSQIATKSLYAICYIILLILINIAILYYDQLVKTQQKELNSYKKNLPIYETLITDIRSHQHEYVNRMQALHNLALFYTDFESLQAALLSYTDTMPQTLKAYPLLQINMPLLSASLYQLYCSCIKKGIHMQFNIANTHLTSTVSEPNLSDYICILTQNAIEACHENDDIYIYLSSEKEHVQFEIRNPIDHYVTTSEIQQFYKKGYSTKSPTISLERGYGLSYLLQQVQKQKGILFSDCCKYDETYWIIFRLNI